MIGDIIFGKEKSKITLIEDTVLQNGKAILLSIICQMCERLEKVYLICFERDPSFIMDLIPDRYGKRLVPYDGSKDVLGWENSLSLNVNTDLVSFIQNDQRFRPNHSVGVVIDSLSPMLLHRPPSYTCKTLAGLMSAKIHTAEVEQVACLVHDDLHDSHHLSLVEHVVTTVIKVRRPSIPQFLMACHILHKRLSGKVVKTTEHFNLDEELQPVDITEIKSVSDTSHMTTESTNQTDPTANLTFNLTLTDKEKEAKSRVILPYTYGHLRPDGMPDKSVGEGKIFYQPDEADDFDEEDPDDDLDI